MGTQSVIKIENLTKTYHQDFWQRPNLVLDKINFNLQQGTIIGLVGANGAGKTTLLKIMMGFTSPDSGNIYYQNNEDIISFKRRVGFFPERPYFYQHLTGMEFLIFQGKLSGLSKKDILLSCEKWANRLKIEHALSRRIKGYSKGMLQRLGFLSILLSDPEFLIMDEPLSGLDPLGRKEFKDIIKELNLLGKTIFFSSHIISDIEEICHRVIFLNNSVIQFDGSLEEIFQKYPPNKFEIKVDRPIDLEGVNFKKNPEGYYNLILEDNAKEVISKLVQHDVNILSLGPYNYNLEQIIYHMDQR